MKQLEDNYNKLYLFPNFFIKNHSVFTAFLNYYNLYSFYKELNEFIKSGKKFNNPEQRITFQQSCIEKLSLKDIIFLLVFLELSFGYEKKEEKLAPLILFVDNLDYIDDFNQLKAFVKAIDDFTIEMEENFSKFRLYQESEVAFQYIDKIKIFIAMRETTKANIPAGHFSDVLNAIYTRDDMTEWFNKGEIVKKRLLLIKDNSLKGNPGVLSVERVEEFDTIQQIIDDTYTNNIFIPLFNNDYRRSIRAITEIVSNNPKIIQDYKNLMEKVANNTLFEHDLKYGARGIIYNLLIRKLYKSVDNENTFKKIGVLDLLDRKTQKVSICRVILAYLSNKTGTGCDSPKDCISIWEILNAFDGIFDNIDILESLWNMYSLSNSNWSHLVSFCQIEFPHDSEETRLLDSKDLSKVDFDKTLLHYSCAGKTYLEYITTHFEFFVVRLNKNYNPLFCRINYKKESGKYGFERIIEAVYKEVEKCCNNLKEYNTLLCSIKDFPDPYESNSDYQQSDYICQIKKKNRRPFRQYHEEGLISTHIGYIDRYRLFLLNISDICEHEKDNVNRILVNYITKYVKLLDSSILISPRTKITLIPLYYEKIKEVENNINNYKLSINTEGIEN
jgi:hypothetical protein